MNNSSPIGVFDSGIGGLTVLKDLIEVLPSESFIYLGDTARVPYGIRDAETIRKFSEQMVMFLLERDVKAIVVACNTISAIALDRVLELAGDLVTIDVITPTVLEAARGGKHIGVIGTRATVASGAYEKQFSAFDKRIQVYSKAAPLFVPLIEEGLIQSDATKIIAKEYLNFFTDKDLDTIILACTHYPIIRHVFKEFLPKVNVIESGKPTAQALRSALKLQDLQCHSGKPSLELYVTDNPDRASQVANIFFEGNLPAKIRKINLSAVG